MPLRSYLLPKNQWPLRVNVFHLIENGVFNVSNIDIGTKIDR